MAGRTEINRKNGGLQMSGRWFYVFFLFLFGFMVKGGVNGEVVDLIDDNFEHETQASTGMTTGSWWVLFKADRCGHCQALMPHFEKLSVDAEDLFPSVVFATVDVPSNRGTTVRFGIRGFPTLIFLHQHKLYRYFGKRTTEGMTQFIQSVMDGTTTEEGEPIPSPPTAWEQTVKIAKAAGLELYDAAMGKSGTVGYAIIGMLVILLLIFGGILSLFFLPARKVKSQ